MKLFQDIIFKECTDEELILIADFLNAAFDETLDAVYDELFVKMKAMVSYIVTGKQIGRAHV